MSDRVDYGLLRARLLQANSPYGADVWIRHIKLAIAAAQREGAERALEGALEAVQVLGRTGVLGGHSINHVCDAIRALFPTPDAGGPA